MPTKSVNAYSVTDGLVTLNTVDPHGLIAGDYFSVRNVNSNVNGQFTVSFATTNTLSYSQLSAPNTALTSVSGSIISTTIDQTGKPAYMYNENEDTWVQLSAKVNTSGNYSWTGTHLFQAPVTVDDVIILKNTSGSAVVTTGGGCIFVENGALKFKGSNGTITTIAPA